MRSKYLKNTITLCLVLFATTISFAYNYNEHQDIGNKAMTLYFNQNNSFENTIFGYYLPIRFDNQSQTYLFSQLSTYNFPIGYGAINGLSGDHVENPLLLEEQLLTKNSTLLKIIALHNLYINLGYSGAPDSKLTKLDNNYAFLALKNLSHFYEYGKGLQANIAAFDIQSIENIINPSEIGTSFKKLNGTNAINMYITLHTAAIYLAELAGVKAINNDPAAKKYLYYSFLYNGFADHFLEDAFSGGHLLVNRSISASFTNNKSIHDFYSKNGTEVVNLRGEYWKEYGDGYYNQYHKEYTKKDSLLNVNYDAETTESKRIVEAVSLSLTELFEAFERGYQQGSNIQYIPKKIPSESKSMDEKCIFFTSNFKALHIIPLPYNTELKKIMPDSLANNKVIKDINQTPYYRSFIRSRIANSFIFGSNTGFKGYETSSYNNAYVRINVGLIKSKYEFNKYNHKKGMVDIWHGYTVSYTLGNYIGNNQDIIGKNWTLKGGFRSNYDFWLTNKRFLGVYMYNEIGMGNKDSRKSFVYVPQIGLQIGSLLNIHYYNMPFLLRLAAQTFLPLKIHLGCVFSATNRPLYFYGSEINIAF